MKKKPPGMQSSVALGVRTHSGWAVVVIVCGPRHAPVVLGRRRIELADRHIRGSKQPYHTASAMNMTSARLFIKTCTNATRRLARSALREIIGDLRTRGHAIAGVGILLGSATSPVSLDAAIASHLMRHTAEGHLYRDAIDRAAKHFELSVIGMRERDVLSSAAALIGMPVASVQRRLAELGKALGPPWRQDQKLAASVAWAILASKNEHDRAG